MEKKIPLTHRENSSSAVDLPDFPVGKTGIKDVINL